MPEFEERHDSINAPPKKNFSFEHETEGMLGDLGVVIEKEEYQKGEILSSETLIPTQEEIPIVEEEEIQEVKEEQEAFETIITEEPFEEVKEEGEKVPPPTPKPSKPTKQKIPIIPFIKRGLKILLLGIGITGVLSLSYPAYIFFYKPHKHFKSGVSLIQSGEFKKAEEELKEGLNFARTRLDKVNAYNQFGIAYLKAKEYKKAEEMFNEAFKIVPHNPVVKNNLVKLYIEKGNLKKSEEICKDILKTHPTNIPAYINLSRVLLMTSRPQGAIKCLKYALSINKKDIEALSLYQYALAKTGKYRDALSIHRYLYYITKNKYLYYPDDLAEIGHIYFKKGDLVTSSDILNRILKHYPKHANARYYLAQVLLKEHKPDEAIKELEKDIKYNPNYDDAYALLGKIYFDKKMYDKALIMFRKATTVNPENGKAFEGMGNVYYYNLNAYNEAATSYLKALDHGITSLQIKYNLGICLYKTANFDKALAIWQDFLAIEEKNPIINFNLANTYVWLHNLDQAKNAYDNLINFYKERIKKGATAKEKKEIYQELSFIYNNLGVITELEGEGKKALSSYWQALEFASLADTDNETAYSNLNRIFKLESLKSINQALNDVKKGYKIK